MNKVGGEKSNLNTFGKNTGLQPRTLNDYPFPEKELFVNLPSNNGYTLKIT